MTGVEHRDEIWLRTAHLTVEVAASRGAEIRRIERPGGDNVLFRQDWQTPVRATDSISYGSTENDWLSQWRGGWQELFPNAGAAAEALGVPLPFHGDVSSARWSVIERDATSVTLQSATRLPLMLTRRMWLDPDAPVLHLQETVHNESDLEVPFLWGHHPAFDALPGTVLDLPAGRAVAPADYRVAHADLVPGDYRWPTGRHTGGHEIDLSLLPAGPVERVVYRPDVEAGWAALRRPDGLGVAMAFDTDVFRHLWLWIEIGGADFPWYGRSRVVAVEPMSSWPNDGLTAAIARGRADRLGPAGSVSGWLTLSLFDAGDAPVTGVDKDGSVSFGTPAY